MDIYKHKFTDKDKLFLDTNIWFYIFGPQDPKYQKNDWMAVYSWAFKRILKAKCDIYIDVIVVAEFINRYARLRWNVEKAPDVEFKDYRKSSDFKLVAQDIVADLKKVMEHCLRIENGFEILNIDVLLNEFGKGKSDFNDQVIAGICKSYGLTLLTNDGDFKNQDLPILTANSFLLR